MQNHVSAETALKLKEAGFPQPVPEFLQVWVLEGLTSLPKIVMFSVPVESRVVFLGAENVDYRQLDQLYAFAPTATDILRELGAEYFLSAIYPDLFEVGIIDPYDYSKDPQQHENPAEAAALAYLAIKGKP